MCVSVSGVMVHTGRADDLCETSSRAASERHVCCKVQIRTLKHLESKVNGLGIFAKQKGTSGKPYDL